MSINNEWNRNVKFGLVNSEEGLFISVNGMKYYFMKNSDICGLMRSIIMSSVKEIQTTIKARRIKDNVKYTKANEMFIKATFTAEDMELKEDYAMSFTKIKEIQKEKKKEQVEIINNSEISSDNNNNTVEDINTSNIFKPVDIREALRTCEPALKHIEKPIIEQIMEEVKEETISKPIKEVVSEPVKIEEKPKAVKSSKPKAVKSSKPKSVKKPVKSSKPALKHIEKPIIEQIMEEVKEETISKPIKEVVSEPVKEVVSEPVKEVVSEPVKIEDKAVKSSKPKSVKKPVKSKKDSKELKIGGYKITDKHISLFNQIKEACIDLGVSELKRDEARKYKIYYRNLNDGTWGVLREQYKTYMEKFA